VISVQSLLLLKLLVLLLVEAAPFSVLVVSSLDLLAVVLDRSETELVPSDTVANVLVVTVLQ
jgi:hypothetical protein